MLCALLAGLANAYSVIVTKLTLRYHALRLYLTSIASQIRLPAFLRSMIASLLHLPYEFRQGPCCLSRCLRLQRE